MGEEVKVTCDQCEKDLSYTKNLEAYRLILDYDSIPWYKTDDGRFSPVTLVAIRKPIHRKHIFCGLECLKGWINK